MNEKLARATQESLKVDLADVEKSLTELWRGESEEAGRAVTRAALWNVVAHTSSERDQHRTAEVLAKVSVTVPQRTIVIRSEPAGPAEMSAWISANCHRVGAEKQICSEQVSIAAGGHRVNDVPPLVNALLIADMPVAVWWDGDLPDRDRQYVDELLEPADRLIVDSSQFDSASDLALLHDVGERTSTAPADLSWVRIEQWRSATASLFDLPPMRERLAKIAHVTIAASRNDGPELGQKAESLLYAAWLTVQSRAAIEYEFKQAAGGNSHGSLKEVHIGFSDGTDALIVRSGENGVVTTRCSRSGVGSATHPFGCATDELIVRQLKNPSADRVFMKALPAAVRLASGIGG